MGKSYTKYFILAATGALIIGIGSFILVNNYFEKVEIVIASNEISAGKVIEESDLDFALYYKNSLPEGYLTKKELAVGKKILLERKPKDPITNLVFKEDSNKSLAYELGEGEVLVGINIEKNEPIVKEIFRGSKVCIISTQVEKEFALEYTKSPFEYDIFSISDNIYFANGQLIVKNLEVVDVIKYKNTSSLYVSSGKDENTNIYLKCNFREAPIIARVLKDDNYKIFLENQNL